MHPNIFFKIISWLIRLVLTAIPILVLGWLINEHLALGGELSANYDLNSNSPFISRISPSDRISELKKDGNGVYYRTVLAEPLYFDLTLPRHFDQALVKVKFKNPAGLDFQLGLAGNSEKKQFDLKPLDNQLINNLLADKFNWSAVWEGNLLLLQRGGRYRNVAEFLANLPAESRIAVHNYDLKRKFTLANYRSGPGLTIDHSLRGSLTMYAYIKKENLDFTFMVQDVNRHPGADPISVNVYYQKDEPVFSQIFPDDGEAEATMVMSKPRELNIKMPSLKEGYYKIELPVSEDIFFRQIKTKQNLLVFANQLYLADEVGYWPSIRPTSVYTDGRKLTARTPHLEGRQTLRVGQDNLAVSLVQQDYSVWAAPDIKQGKSKLTAVYSPKNDVLIKTKGAFAFSQESFFNPNITALDDGLDLDEEGIDFVLATYPSSEFNNGWQSAEVAFDLTKVSAPDNKLRLAFSAPEVKKNSQLDIAGISVELKRGSMTWAELVPKLKEYFYRKVDKLLE